MDQLVLMPMLIVAFVGVVTSLGVPTVGALVLTRLNWRATLSACLVWLMILIGVAWGIVSGAQQGADTTTLLIASIGYLPVFVIASILAVPAFSLAFHWTIFPHTRKLSDDVEAVYVFGASPDTKARETAPQAGSQTLENLHGNAAGT